MNTYLNYLNLYKQNKTDGLIILISKFEPLFFKYSHKLKESEDIKSELILYFIELMNSITKKNIEFKEDKYFISYINTSIKRKFINLSKKEQIYIQKNNYNFFDYNITDNTNNIFFYELVRNLKPKEQKILKLKFIYNYKNSEIAKLLNVSRQNVQICLKRSFKKLKSELN